MEDMRRQMDRELMERMDSIEKRLHDMETVHAEILVLSKKMDEMLTLFAASKSVVGFMSWTGAAVIKLSVVGAALAAIWYGIKRAING